MSDALVVRIETEAFERLATDIAVAGIFSDERPLQGGAGRADWRLCGMVSDLLAAGRVSGERGEALMLASTGGLRANRVMLIGLGTRRSYNLDSVREAVRDAIGRCLALAADSVVLAPPGIEPDDFPRHAEVLLEGIRSALDDAVGSGTSLRGGIRLTVARGEAVRCRRALEGSLPGLRRAAPGARGIELESPEPALERNPTGSAPVQPGPPVS